MKKKIAMLTLCALFIRQNAVSADVWGVPIIIEGTSYYTLESTAQDNSVYITDKSGNKIVEQPFYDVKYEGEGYIVRYHGGELNNNCTVLDSNFKEVIPVKYNYIEYNKNTKCYECFYSDNSGKQCFDFYDKEFNKVSQPADVFPIEGTEYYCQKVIDEKSSLANKFYFICDADGNRLIEEGFRKITGLKGFIVVTRFSDYMEGLYNKDLKLAADIKYNWIGFDEESQCIILKSADKVEYLGLDAKYKKPVRKLGETGLYTIENEDGSFYFCDETGTAMSDKKYYDIYDIYNDKIVVRSGNKYPYKFGMVDNNLNTLFEEEYFAIEGNGEGQFKLYENEKVRHYDKMNEITCTDLDYKYITPIKGMENKYIYNMRRSEHDDALSQNKVIIDGDGNALTGFYLNIEPQGEDMYRTITVSAKVGMADSERGMLNSDLKLIVPMGPHTLTTIKESGVVFIEARMGDNIEAYYDLAGNRYGTKEEILKIGEDLHSMSDWAKESIEKAINIGIVPEQLRNAYKKNISRKEFCQIAISTYVAKTGAKIDESAASPFDDVFDKHITAAYNLGIVKGTGYKKFTPDNSITRQEAAVMLRNLANVLKIADTPKKEKFTDESYFADWAKDAIYSVAGIKSGNTYVMAGTEKGKFSPWMSYTREQAIATMLRLYNQSETTYQMSQEVKAESV